MAGVAGGAVVAQRIACTRAWPAGRTTAASVTGSRGSHRWRRAHAGSSDTDDAASTPYGARAITGSGGMQQQEPGRLAGLGGGGEFGPVRVDPRGEFGFGARWVGTPSAVAMRAISAT